MSKICIVGEYDSICAFGALGIDTYPVSFGDDIEKRIDNLVQSDYSIILISEPVARGNKAVIEKYSNTPLPSIVIVPALEGAVSFGMDNLKRAVEQAVGSAQMIFDE